MHDDILVEVSNVSKKFCKDLKRSLWYGVKELSADFLGVSQDKSRLRKDEFWAVKDVSFQLRRGECLGLIGHNGAGKSTLLKMLNGLIRPDEGEIRMRGRVGALIELGAGFNPVLTGRENVYVNGQILGFSKKEIDRKFDAIVDFAELEEFIDSPVQNYSSGMKVRLGFAVAAQMEPDILIVDEVLAVGDIGFRIKCYNEIFKILKTASVVFVSHSMPQVGKVCTRGMLLKNGNSIHESINISEVIASYYNLFSLENTSIEGSKKATIHNIQLINGKKTAKFDEFTEGNEHQFGDIDIHQSLKLEIEYSVNPKIAAYNFYISIVDTDQKLVSQFIPQDPPLLNKKGRQKLLFEANNFILNTGKYSISFHILSEESSDWGETLIGVRSAIKFIVTQKRFFGSAPVLHSAKWELL